MSDTEPSWTLAVTCRRFIEDLDFAEVVDQAVSEYAARHADELAADIERARAVLASGDAAVAAYLLDEPVDAIGRVTARKPAPAQP